MDNEIGPHPKQERLRTRWTAALDKIFVDLVVEQIRLGNRPNNVFDKKTWNHIRDIFNAQTGLNFNNNQLRKHLDVLRTRYYSLKSTSDQNDFALDDACCIGFDLWEDIAAPLSVRVKDCPIYDQLCIIFAEGVDGRYAQSSHYEELLSKPVGIDSSELSYNPDNGTPRSENPSSRPMQVLGSCTEKINKEPAQRGKKRPRKPQSSSDKASRSEGIGNTIAEALLEMIAASKLRTVSITKSDDGYSISSCIKALDAIEDVDQWAYFYALDLFEEPKLRETFISLKSNEVRLAWLHDEYNKYISDQIRV